MKCGSAPIGSLMPASREPFLGRPGTVFSARLADDTFAEERLRAAAHIAGFTSVHFCPEPVAAARDFRGELAGQKLLLVGDFGGGTSDYSLVRMRDGGFALSDVLAIGGVSVAGDALDGALMRHQLVRHFGADVCYRVPLGDNLLRMPKPLMEKLCSPAEMSLLGTRDAQSFLADVRSWCLGPEDQRHIDQLLTLVEDTLGFTVFEAIEAAKKELSLVARTLLSFHVPGIDIEQALTRARLRGGGEPRAEGDRGGVGCHAGARRRQHRRGGSGVSDGWNGTGALRAPGSERALWVGALTCAEQLARRHGGFGAACAVVTGRGSAMMPRPS